MAKKDVSKSYKWAILNENKVFMKYENEAKALVALSFLKSEFPEFDYSKYKVMEVI